MGGIRHLVRLLLTGKRLLLIVTLQQFIMLAGHLLIVFSQQVFTDNIITGKNPEWYLPFVICNVGFLLIIFLSRVPINIEIWALREDFDLKQRIDYMWHVLSLSMSSFSRFSVGDLVARQKSADSTTRRMVMNLLPSFVMITEIVFFAIIMFFYHPLMATVSMSSVILSFITVFFSSKYQRRLGKRNEVADSKAQNATLTSFNNIETIKSAGAEQSVFAQWTYSYAESLAVRIESSASEIWLSAITNLLQHLCTTIIFIIGVWSIMHGDLTPGMLLAFQAILVRVFEPMGEIVTTMQLLVRSISSVERRDEVMAEPSSPYVSRIIDDADMPRQAKLMGEIDMRDVTFGYDRSQPPLIEHFNLHIRPGESIAFVGFSGCGKSTIASLLCGLYDPWEGEILFDGKPRSDIHPAVFNNSVSVINQHIVLFEDTVEQNIKMWDESIEDFAMILASRDAQIHSIISERPGGYKARMMQGGKNFSGGQRQRIEIATALAKEPTILIMDEATSALDTRTEEQVMSSINMLGITQIVIAHRLSTIRDCNNIIVMEHGAVLQQGTHTQLMQDTDGLYYRLMQAV